MSADRDRLARALAEIVALKAENDRLRSLLGLDRPLLAEPAAAWEPTLFVESIAERTPAPGAGSLSRVGKVALYRSLFVGREDVHALRWENPSGKSGWSPAVEGGWSHARTPAREYHSTINGPSSPQSRSSASPRQRQSPPQLT